MHSTAPTTTLRQAAPPPSLLAFRRLDELLARGVAAARVRFGDGTQSDPFRGLYVTDEQAAGALDGSSVTPLLRASRESLSPSWTEICDAHPGWAWVRDTHDLSARELDVLLIAVAPDADLRYERSFAYVQDDVTRRRPTVDLALDLTSATVHDKTAGRVVFAADSALVARHLVELVAEPGAVAPPLLAHVLVVDEQVAETLLLQDGLDRRLTPWCRLDEPAGRVRLPAALDAHAFHALVQLARTRRERPLRCYFHGRSGTGRRSASAALAAAVGARLLSVDLRRLVDDHPSADALDGVLQRVLRSASLHAAVLHLDASDSVREPGRATAATTLSRRLVEHPGVVVLAGEADWVPLGPEPLGVLTVPFAGLDAQRRHETWSEHLGAAGVTAAGEDLDLVARRFRLTARQIADAAATAASQALHRQAAAGGGTGPTDRCAARGAELFGAARSQGGHGLAHLARRTAPVRTWDDLVLPVDALDQLRELCRRVALREQVLGDWGFGRGHSTGQGSSALFAGPPGTGKTMAAEVVAHELGLDLFTVDLAGVVSKYIGETEKNLERIFAAAQGSDAVLLFDEADALFGKRSEVRDSHDRYANIETAYLLQRMEQHDGVAILTTNLRHHIDDAFLRRLQFVVTFPFPDDAERRALWEAAIPSAAPVEEGIDFDALARTFRMSGSGIASSAAHAAFLAAAQQRDIALSHVLTAIRREHQRAGRALPEAQLEQLASAE